MACQNGHGRDLEPYLLKNTVKVGSVSVLRFFEHSIVTKSMRQTVFTVLSVTKQLSDPLKFARFARFSPKRFRNPRYERERERERELSLIHI